MADNYTAQDSHEASSLIAALQKLKCDSIHYIGQGVCPRCLSTVHDALAAALAVVRAEGRKQGLDEAAALCDEAHAKWCANCDRADIKHSGPSYAAAVAGAAATRDIAAAIRALKEKA